MKRIRCRREARTGGSSFIGTLAARDSGDDVGDNAVIELVDFVLQQQLALFQPGDFQLVDSPLFAQGQDLLVQAAMLGLQQLQQLPGIVVVVHWPQSIAQVRLDVIRPRFDGTGRQDDSRIPKHKTNGTFRDLLVPLSVQLRKGMTPMDQSQVEDLESKHAQLEALIDEEEHRPHPDEIRLHELKKEKLKVKDAMVGH